MGTFVLNIVCLQIVNPDNIKSDDDGKFPESVNEKVPTMLWTLEAVRAGMAILSVVLIFPGQDPTSEAAVKDTMSRGASVNAISRHDSNINAVKISDIGGDQEKLL